MFHSRQFSSHSSVPFSFVPNLLTLDKFMIPRSWLIDSSTPTACFVLVSLRMSFFCSYVLRPPFVYNNLPGSTNCCLTVSVLWFSKIRQAKKKRFFVRYDYLRSACLEWSRLFHGVVTCTVCSFYSILTAYYMLFASVVAHVPICCTNLPVALPVDGSMHLRASAAASSAPRTRQRMYLALGNVCT